MTTTYPKCTARKPTGGFVFLTVQQLCLIWWAYRTRLIQLQDLRVWFAAHEIVARRCQLAPNQVPAYTPRELHGLVGGGAGAHHRASLRRLDTHGLLTWSNTTLTFATSPTDLRGVLPGASLLQWRLVQGVLDCRRFSHGPAEHQSRPETPGGPRLAAEAPHLPAPLQSLGELYTDQPLLDTYGSHERRGSARRHISQRITTAL